MTEKIKEHWDLALALGIGLFLAIAGILGLTGTIILPSPALANVTSTVTVTATVEPWLTFSVNPTSAALSPNLVNIVGVTSIASSSNISLILGTNSGGGWSMNIKGANAGLATSTFDLIESVGLAATTTLTNNNTDGYGANATGSIADANVQPNYGGWGTAAVGAIASTTAQNIFIKTSANSSTTVGLMKVYAQCDSAQPSGTYADTITLTAIPIP